AAGIGGLRYPRNKSADGVAGIQAQVARLYDDNHLIERRDIIAGRLSRLFAARSYKSSVNSAGIIRARSIRLEDWGRRRGGFPSHVHRLVTGPYLHCHIPRRACRLRRLAIVGGNSEHQFGNAIWLVRRRDLELQQVRSGRSRSRNNAQSSARVARGIRQFGDSRREAIALRRQPYTQTELAAMVPFP